MKTIENLFNEFLDLARDRVTIEGVISNSLRDCFLEDIQGVVLLRNSKEGLGLYFLDRGESIVIPRKLYLLGKNFLIYSGAEIFHRKDEGCGKLGKFIYLLTKIIDSSDTSRPDSSIVSNFIELVSIGTREIRLAVSSRKKDLLVPEINYTTRENIYEV